MSITTRSMLQEIESLRDRFDRFTREMPVLGEMRDSDTVSLDVQETSNTVIVKASVPGINRRI